MSVLFVGSNTVCMYKLDYKKMAMAGFMSVSVVACVGKENNYLVDEEDKEAPLKFIEENFCEINTIMMEINKNLSEDDQVIFNSPYAEVFIFPGPIKIEDLLLSEMLLS